MKNLSLFILSAMLLLLPIGGCAGQPLPEPLDIPAGYRASCWTGQYFLAVGTGGRIDEILPDKTVTSIPCETEVNLHGIASVNGFHIIVGDRGTILTAGWDYRFTPADCPVKNDLFGVAAFGGGFVAVGRGGTVLTSDDGTGWKRLDVGVTEDFLAVAAGEEICLAVTYEGKVLIMRQVDDWEILDYNTAYETLGTTFNMRSVNSGGDGCLVVGSEIRDPEVPVLFTTRDGEIWQPVSLEMLNDSFRSEYYPLTLNTAGRNGDQLLLGADGGKLITVTSCAKCNQLTTVSDKNIHTIAASPGGFVLLAGEDFWSDIMDDGEVRQYGIKAEQAREEQQSGQAYIVDVRTPEEYIEGHIPGALHIPVDKIAEMLESVIPDHYAKIIFYCLYGGRSQTALETALELGYERVYNLGGIEDDWPYEVEAGDNGLFVE